MTESEFKQAIREAMRGKYTWVLSGPADQMKAHCSHCGGAAPKDENGKTRLTDLCPHCGEEMFHKEEPQEQKMWWDEDYDPDVDDPMKDLITPSTLTPGGDCLGDGLHPGYRCLCEGCDYEAECMEAYVDEDLLARLKEMFTLQEGDFRANDVFVKHYLQELRELGSLDFLEKMADSDKVRILWNKSWYPEAIWLLKLFDQVYLKHFDCVAQEYQDIRETQFFAIIPGPELSKEQLDKVTGERWLRVCRVVCKCCGDVLERTYKSPEDYGGGLMTCKCGKVSFDPSPTLWRVIGRQENFEIQNELAEL